MLSNQPGSQAAGQPEDLRRLLQAGGTVLHCPRLRRADATRVALKAVSCLAAAQQQPPPLAGCG